MARILALETSSHICSVAIGDAGQVIAGTLLEDNRDKTHAALLGVFIKKALDVAGFKANQLDAIAVSKGPGSYTGLRIGVSTAKGLAYSAGIPLIAVDTLQSLAANISTQILANGYTLPNRITISSDTWLCPMFDARRMEVYCAFYNLFYEVQIPVAAQIITATSFDEILSHRQVLFFGDGSTKCKELIAHPNALYIDNINPSAMFMLELADKAFSNKQFEDVAYFEPFYLKDFVATVPKRKVF